MAGKTFIRGAQLDAALGGISRSTRYRYIQRGIIPQPVKIAGRDWFPADTPERVFEAQARESVQAAAREKARRWGQKNSSRNQSA